MPEELLAAILQSPAVAGIVWLIKDIRYIRRELAEAKDDRAAVRAEVHEIRERVIKLEAAAHV